MQNIVTLGEINDALKFTTVTAAQLAEMGFAALANKPICEALPQEEARRLRTAKLYPAESIGQIRVALAKRLAAPASCLHQIQEPAPATTEIITALWEAIGHHSAQVAETGEMSPGQKLLDAARAVEMAIPPAAIATLPKSDYLEGVNIPNLREALIFLGRENGVGEGEVGDKLAQYVNSVVSGVLSKKATLHEAPQAAPAAVAVPDAVRDALLQSEAALEVATARILKADPDHSISVTSEAKALVAVRAALAATPAADAPLYAEMLAALQSVGMDAVGVGGGENTISDSARAKVEAVLEKIGAPWPSSDTAAAAPVVLPEPIPQWLLDMEWCVIEHDRSGYSQAWCPQCGGCQTDYFDGKAGHKDGCELRALLAGVSAPAAQAVWDGKLPESLQRALNELRIDCKTDAVSSLEFEVRSVFEGMHTSLTTVKRMYHAAQKRLDSTDAAQPDPFAAPQAQAVPDGWREQFETKVYADLAAADNQDVPLEEYPARILKVLDSIVGPRHPAVVQWRNDAIKTCIAIAYKYCRDPDSHKYLKQDLEALLTAEPAPAAKGVRDE